ncbi:MAG: xanthine dehydrogenase [Herminiimonas sp.]|nr:xanthine dehydrogenase [Herminiimonas sp.]
MSALPSAGGAAYLRPDNVFDAVSALATRPLTILAGGTDFYAARSGLPVNESILDISNIGSLRGLREEGAHWRIGPATTWSDILRAELEPSLLATLRGLRNAARDVGGIQVQNMGTIAGNVCNASPAADGIPVLMALDAQIELTSLSGVRCVALQEFVLGSRRTARRPDELVSGILIPRRRHARSSFQKLGHRRYLVISIVMVAVVLDTNDAGQIDYAGVAVGACSARALRLLSLERKLIGQPINTDLTELLAADDLQPLTPIDDVRGTGSYRRDAAMTLIRRTLQETLQ